MIDILFKAYPDEIAYSWFARNIKTSGNLSYTESSYELFGLKVALFNIYYPTHLDFFVEQLPSELRITAETIINENTIFPLFKPFMSVERANKVVNNMKSGDSRRLIGEMGINSGHIFINEQKVIKVCSKCYREDIEKYGEAYIHRQHQVPGNFIRNKHEIYLTECLIPFTMSSYFLFDINDIDVEYLEISDIKESIKKNFIELEEDIKFVLNGGLQDYDLQKINDKYRKMLRKKGYLLNE